MLAEPYIHLPSGEIRWLNMSDVFSARQNRTDHEKNGWQPYADFEREKLNDLGGCNIKVVEQFGYSIIATGQQKYLSGTLLGYYSADYNEDSESNRLLKRAEFLKSVCEKEGVQFIPAVANSDAMKKCCIEGCDSEGANGRGNHCWKHYHRIRKYGDPTVVGHQWKIAGLHDHDGIKRMIEEKVAVNLETGCWEWTGTRHKQGYGKQTIKRSEQKVYPTHRLAAMVYLGFDIDSEKLVCHKCDNPPCCNPDHLFIGDWKSNAADMVQKGRAVDVSDRERDEDGTFLPKSA